MKKFAIGCVFLLLIFLFYVIQQPIQFYSKESKNLAQQAVQNRIQFRFGIKEDLWLMQQNHHPEVTNFDQWDLLAIRVDKSSRPYKSYFYQLKPGNNKDINELKNQMPIKVPCFMCHNSGPRAIRPQSLATFDSVRIWILNLRIKTYFATHSLPGNSINSKNIYRILESLNTPIPLKSCQKCHNNNGLRQTLTMDMWPTIRFLVNNKMMPPWPYQMEREDQILFDKIDGEYIKHVKH